MVDEAANSDGQAEALARLVRAAAQRDPQAWTALVKLYAPRLYALVFSRTRNATVSEDIAQSVLATAAVMVCQGSYSEEGRFESWLFRIAMNRVRDHVRSQKRRGTALSIDVAGDVASQRDDTGTVGDDGVPLSQRLAAAMQQLSEADREVVELRHHGGMSFRDMAEVLGEPLGTLLARHHRALAKLKAILSSDGGELAGGPAEGHADRIRGTPPGKDPNEPRKRALDKGGLRDK